MNSISTSAPVQKLSIDEFKVFGGNTYIYQIGSKFRRVILAARSMAGAHRRLRDEAGIHIPYAHMRKFWCKTGNKEEIGLASDGRIYYDDGTFRSHKKWSVLEL